MPAVPFLLGLDYELFFGSHTGTVQRCLIEPIDALLKCARPHGVKLTLFVDAGYLYRLKQESDSHPRLAKEYDLLARQLHQLTKAGHNAQLHIHPHWQDSYYNGEQWVLDKTRYRLHDFDPGEIQHIVREYKGALQHICDNEVFAYRAGGWCIQPFDRLATALADNAIWLDSTVYQGGRLLQQNRYFDFTHCPSDATWRFSTDPCEPDDSGQFVELPISVCRIQPWFFWKMILAKKLGGERHRNYGDGSAMSASKSYYFRLLSRPTNSVVSIDGLKAGFLAKACAQHLRRNSNGYFNVMGHPKALSPYSIEQFNRFLQNPPATLEPMSFKNLKTLRPH